MKKVLFSGLIALAVLAAGCSKTEPTPGDNGEKGSIRIAIKGQPASERAIGTPTQVQENTVLNFTAYVFNHASGVLEGQGTFTNVLEGNITGLGVASQKRVVVLVNVPAGFPTITNYGDLAEAAAMIGLDTQVPGDFSTTGLFMSGEYPSAVTLSTTATTNVTVTVERLTAKVRLGTLTVDPDAGLDLADFSLAGVSIQKARDAALPMGTLATSGFNYVGGVQLPANAGSEVPYLYQAYTLPGGYVAGTELTPNVYFYVFPNNNTNGNATLLTLEGTYDGNTMYFPFVINNESSNTGGNSTDGNYVQRNKVYTLNVTLRKVGSGGTDPNIPNESVAMDVTVVVADWESELVQNVEW